MDWLTYSIADFVPYTAETYRRLAAQINEAAGLWRTLALFAPWLLLAAAWQHKWQRRFSTLSTVLLALTLAASWVSCGYIYFATFYSQLNWAAGYLAWGFYAQAFLLLAAVVPRALSSTAAPASNRPNIALRTIAMGLMLAAACWPLAGWILGRTWQQTERFGLFPDATAVFTLGFMILLASRNTVTAGLVWGLAITSVIPLLWLVVSSAFLSVLMQPERILICLAIAATIIALAVSLTAVFSARFQAAAKP
ncbi:hypothetical protein [Halioxenophilus aromaticivorans]|uniref:MFS transporter permease n=1 Tax=Halioxenophilus aromaticivorans TaxID=1306992 RepID=A0AAV3TYF6_9ALTE